MTLDQQIQKALKVPKIDREKIEFFTDLTIAKLAFHSSHSWDYTDKDAKEWIVKYMVEHYKYKLR